MRRYKHVGAAFFVLVALMLLGLAMSVGFAQTGGELVGSDSGASKTASHTIFLPMVTYNEPETTLPFSDDFDDGVDNWTPYTNIRRMNEDQWFWDPGAGVGGSASYTHFCKNGVTDPDDYAEDTLTMYLGEGSEEWTDYRYSVDFNMLGGRQIGVWFRGTYRDSENKGQWVTGYYFTVRVRRNNGVDSAKLFQLRTEEEPGDETWPPYWYHVTNPLELVEVDLATPIEQNEWHKITIEVEGPRIKGYVDDELAIDFVDDEGSVFLNGTVGMYGYGNPYGIPQVWGVFKYDNVLVEPLN